ncbi:MAG: hypothetical protein HRU12_11715 [Phaeodactylibacter sp.]|nr:hypothetical protein [Phaeodactylibacter sp.]
MELRDWVETILVGVFGFISWWIKTEHSKIKTDIENLKNKKSDDSIRLSVIENDLKHINEKLKAIESNFEKLFQKFDNYDEERAEFLKTFELIPKK